MSFLGNIVQGIKRELPYAIQNRKQQGWDAFNSYLGRNSSYVGLNRRFNDPYYSSNVGEGSYQLDRERGVSDYSDEPMGIPTDKPDPIVTVGLTPLPGITQNNIPIVIRTIDRNIRLVDEKVKSIGTTLDRQSATISHTKRIVERTNSLLEKQQRERSHDRFKEIENRMEMGSIDASLQSRISAEVNRRMADIQPSGSSGGAGGFDFLSALATGIGAGGGAVGAGAAIRGGLGAALKGALRLAGPIGAASMILDPTPLSANDEMSGATHSSVSSSEEAYLKSILDKKRAGRTLNANEEYVLSMHEQGKSWGVTSGGSGAGGGGTTTTSLGSQKSDFTSLMTRLEDSKKDTSNFFAYYDSYNLGSRGWMNISSDGTLTLTSKQKIVLSAPVIEILGGSEPSATSPLPRGPSSRGLSRSGGTSPYPSPSNPGGGIVTSIPGGGNSVPSPKGGRNRSKNGDGGPIGPGGEASSALVDGDGRIISTASTDLTPVQRALLDTLAMGDATSGENYWESPDYNTIVGGRKFEGYADHPRIFGTRESTAAGRYQFTKTTWDDVVRRYNAQNPDNPITDFSPQNQDRAALFLASADYARRTGRNLEKDLQSGSPQLGDFLKAGLGGHGKNTTWQILQLKSGAQIQRAFDSNLGRNQEYAASAASSSPAVVGKGRRKNEPSSASVGSSGNNFSVNPERLPPQEWEGNDPRINDIVMKGAEVFGEGSPYGIRAFSGNEGRGMNHQGHAVDWEVFDKETGEAIPQPFMSAGPGGRWRPEKGTGGATENHRIYEQAAQAMRLAQMRDYPELNDTFRWGGYFGGSTPNDTMHVDITPRAGGSTSQGNWDEGLRNENFGRGSSPSIGLARYSHLSPEEAIKAYRRDLFAENKWKERNDTVPSYTEAVASAKGHDHHNHAVPNPAANTVGEAIVSSNNVTKKQALKNPSPIPKNERSIATRNTHDGVNMSAFDIVKEMAEIE